MNQQISNAARLVLTAQERERLTLFKWAYCLHADTAGLTWRQAQWLTFQRWLYLNGLLCI